MDIWGVEGVAAEAELLSAMVAFLERVGLGPEDVGIKVRVVFQGSSRTKNVLEAHTSRVRRFSNFRGSDRVVLTRPDPTRSDLPAMFDPGP